MTTLLVRETMRTIADLGIDPASLHWFDATGCLTDKSHQEQGPIQNSRPPFERCMICLEGSSGRGASMRLILMVVGDDPENGVVITVWRWSAGSPPVQMAPMVYVVHEGLIKYGPYEESDKMDKTDAEMILGFMSAWYESLSRRVESYLPTPVQTYTNRRKIAQGKVPVYEWRTVVIEPAKPRSESQGGTHASPRLHDRRGHLRRLQSGKNVWVKPCKVGSPSNGIVFKDYQISH